MADQPERHPATKSTDTASRRELENIGPGVNGSVAEEEAEFIQNVELAAPPNSTTNADVATTLESADSIDSHKGFDTTAAEGDLVSTVDGDEPVQSDDGIDLLATSNYPEGTIRPGPEDSADLFDSLAADERTNTQVSDSRLSSEDEIAGQHDLPAANLNDSLAYDEISASLEFGGKSSEANDSVEVVPTELCDMSISTSKDSADDIEDISDPLQDSLSRQVGVTESFGDTVDNSAYSNQGAESDDLYQTAVDIGQANDDPSVQSDASSAGARVLTYDNLLEEGDEMRWFTIGMPILLVTVIIIMGGYVYSLQSQIDEIQVLLSSEEEDFFDAQQSNGSVLLNESTLAHVNARIDNLADSVEAIAKRTPDQTGDEPSGTAGRDGMSSVNKDLAILTERVKNLEDKDSARPLVLRKVSKVQTGNTAKPKTSTPKTVKMVKPDSSVEPKPPVIRSKSRAWAVNLMSVTEKVDAEQQLKGFRNKGVAAVIQPKTISGKQWYRIQVTGFGSKQKAKDYAVSVKAKLGLASAWVTR